MNRFRIVVVCLSIGLTILISCKEEPEEQDGFNLVRFDPLAVQKENPMHLYVHYMPWFEDKLTSSDGNWGTHWTMATRNPEIMDEDGKREIASHFYPMIGPYSSKDPDVIEYHLLLMKYCGIEGILIDWYGAQDINDYASIRENTEAIIRKLDEVGLKFAIVYEDRTVSAAVQQNPDIDRIATAKEDMRYLEDHYFEEPSYIRLDGLPMFMVFGPEEFHNSQEWSEILSEFYIEPLFLILNGKSAETYPSSSGEYIWVDNNSLDNKYSGRNNFEYFIGGAYPGFLDYYEEGGWGEGFNWEIDHRDGDALSENLEKALQYEMEYLQLITWNDFGEGTMLEPTFEFGYEFLDRIQQFAGIEYTTTELEYIYKLFMLRKENEEEEDFYELMDQVFYYFVSLQTEKAVALVDSLEAL
jgi:hypothetical protein